MEAEDGAGSYAGRRFILRRWVRLTSELDTLLLKQCKTDKNMLRFVQKSDVNLTIYGVNALMTGLKIFQIFNGRIELKKINYQQATS